MAMDFPGNSHAARIEPPDDEAKKTEPEDLKKAIEGKVVVRKPSLGKQFKEMFANESGNFKDHIIQEVILPMIQAAIVSTIAQGSDAVRQVVEDLVYKGTNPSSRGYRPGGRGPVSYNRYANGNSSVRRNDNPPQYRPAIRRSNVVEDIILESREDGIMVLEMLEQVIERQGYTTVGDLYSTVDPEKKLVDTDELWGWRDLGTARVTEVRGGYLLVLPRPVDVQSRR